MKRSLQRMLTTHNGSLPRPRELREMLIAKDRGAAPELETLDLLVRKAVADVVNQQANAGLAVINDGEMSKVSYATYIKERLAGFGGDENTVVTTRAGDAKDFPEWVARQPDTGIRRPACNGPISWKDFGAVTKDIENLTAATRTARVEDIFMSAIAPSTVTNFHPNRYYPTHEAYLQAVATAMSREYKAITDAGFVLQLDWPVGSGVPARTADQPFTEFRKGIAIAMDVLNEATKDIEPEKMRLHVCWGAGEGPHHLDRPLKDVVDVLLKARPAGMTIASANGRHSHEWKVWKDAKVPEGKVIVPGVIDSTTNIIEHPEALAERIARYASVLGRQNVIGGVDCGFATSIAREQPQVDEKIAWAKLKSLSDGAALATKDLWRK